MSTADHSPEFIEFLAQRGEFLTRRSSGDRRVLKQAHIQQGKRRLVGGSPVKPASEAKAELLYEGEEVIGVRLICTCGKATEIYFEYGEPKELSE